MLIEVLVTATLFADSVTRTDPAACFCAWPARDLSLGHFESRDSFVVDVPLSQGPNGMREPGERIHIDLGYPPSLAWYLLGEYRHYDDSEPEWCALLIDAIAAGPADIDNEFVSGACRYTQDDGSYPASGQCTEFLSLRELGTLSPAYAFDKQGCFARARRVGLAVPSYDGCAGGGTSLLGLFLLTRRRRP